jgi:integrase
MIGSSRFQNGSLILVKNKTTAGTWFLRFYEYADGKRVYRKRKIGTVREYPHRRDAEKAVLALRAKINSEFHSPETVNELIPHYTQYELSAESGKRSSTCEVYAGFIKLHVTPKWGKLRLDQVKTVAVEQWLRSLPYAPATRAKIRNILSAIFAHAVRYGLILHNPIKGVRCSSKRQREPDVLTPEEFSSLLAELPDRERVMVALAGTAGLRRSELIALKWRDVDFEGFQLDVNKSWVHGKIGETKTKASARPVPLHPDVADILKRWKLVTPYRGLDDFLFPSIRENGAQPVWPDMILQKIIRPAAKRAGISKRIGWHTFRHSLGTNLRALGVDVKVAQELLRHANSSITLDLYTQAVSAQKREANDKVVELLLPSPDREKKTQHPSAPSEVADNALSC